MSLSVASIPRLRKKILAALAGADAETISTSDDGWCDLLGVPHNDYDLLQSAFVQLRNTGKIEWYRRGNGSENNARALEIL